MRRVEIKPSALDGLGVFAVMKFERGDELFRFIGQTISFTDTLHLKTESAPLQIGRDIYIHDPGFGAHVNHSCEPNVGLQDCTRIVALRQIQVGEEIVFDYSTSMDEGSWTMECRCGTPSCRGRIRDFVRLPPALQDHYLKKGIVQPFIAIKLVRSSASGTMCVQDRSQ